MRHILFDTPSARYRVALLCKPSIFKEPELLANYVQPLIARGLKANEIVAIPLEYDEKGKASAKLCKDVLDHLLPALFGIGITHLFVTDSDYFKVLTKVAKVDPHYGHLLELKYGPPDCLAAMKVCIGINYQQIIFNPAIQGKLDLTLNALAEDVQGKHITLGSDIIHSAYYPRSVETIREALKALHQYPALTVDIEAFSLKFWDAGIGTVSFAWDEHNGIAFPCDYSPILEEDQALDPGMHGYYVPNLEVRELLREFFETYQGEIIFHNVGYDVKVKIFYLWMKDLLDQEELLKGLEIMSRHWHDTKLIAYLALNSTARQEYGLKSLAHEFAGNWAMDDEVIKDIRKIPLDTLLQYNLVDALSTWYVFKKYHPRMIQDQQEPIYTGLYLPTARLLIQMELTGMPMDRQRIITAKHELTAVYERTMAVIMGHPMIPQVEQWRAEKEAEKDYETRKAKAKNPDKIQRFPWQKYHEPFNVNSGPQMQAMLYGFMGLPVIDYTKTKQPATGAETIEKLLEHPIGKQHAEFLQALIDYTQVAKILGTYIPAFEAGIVKGNDTSTLWLHGSFILGYVVSGRLSSREPNLTNIPAKSAYGKMVKTIFRAPKDWIFAGADFNSLEDMISALTTKDPNKLKVYTDGYDGHSLRAVAYWPEEFAYLNPDDVNQVNQLKKDDHPLRQESKTPTFALTYQGTYLTLMINLGWSMEKAKKVEAAYHELYKVSDQWVQDRLQQASKDGFVTVAFGLRVRTPLLAQCVYGPRMPREAQAEARTAGNALGQSYCQLTNRAAVEFWQRVWASPYRTKILPCALIHDAIYALIWDDLEVVAWVNKNLIECMRWQELPDIQHDTVKIGASLELYWPNWSKAAVLPNDCDAETIVKTVNQHRHDILNPKPKEQK